jgi:hypothetical protein
MMRASINVGERTRKVPGNGAVVSTSNVRMN